MDGMLSLPTLPISRTKSETFDCAPNKTTLLNPLASIPIPSALVETSIRSLLSDFFSSLIMKSFLMSQFLNDISQYDGHKMAPLQLKNYTLLRHH